MPTSSSTPEPRVPATSTRDRILDAAEAIMRRDGLVRATTKEIAREAGCSEALLYKHFPDKRDIFLRVLTDRSPRLDTADAMPGTGTVVGNLESMMATMLEFYAQNFPVAVSIFSSSDLLGGHRDAMAARGAGPHAPSRLLARYLEQEVQLGRLPPLDTDAIAHLLTGAALHEAFLATYTGQPIREAAPLAQRLVGAIGLSR